MDYYGEFMTKVVKSTRSSKEREPLAIKSTRSPKEREQLAIIGVAIGVVVVFVAIMALALTQASNRASDDGTTNYKALYQTTTTSGMPILGDPEAKITIMEFADFSCPHCMDYHPVIKQIIDQYVRTGQARLIFQPQVFVYPPYSSIAAQAALCAQKQGAFWEMHDALFALAEKFGPNAFETAKIADEANKLGLDSNKIVECIVKQETVGALESSLKAFEDAGAGGTPAVLYSVDGENFQWFKSVDGTNMGGTVPFIAIAKMIEDAQG
jgi:protein-disulfide isomerase